MFRDPFVTALDMDPFVFDPLPQGSGHIIRVLKLEPGAGEQPMCGSLHVVDLEDSNRQNYDALSYVWGNDDPSQQRSLGGRVLMVRPNLYNFLLRLRGKKSVRCFWTDAICIDQANSAEKSQQVSIMDRVYKQSSVTRVWLGEPDAATEYFVTWWINTRRQGTFKSRWWTPWVTGRSLSKKRRTLQLGFRNIV